MVKISVISKSWAWHNTSLWQAITIPRKQQSGTKPYNNIPYINTRHVQRALYTHWDVYLTLSFSTESLVCRRTSVTRWTLRRCYCSWKSIHQKQSYRTEPAEACCLCCNPFIASLCHQFTQKVTLPSESRVRNTQSVKRKKVRVEMRDSVKWHVFWVLSFLSVSSLGVFM